MMLFALMLVGHGAHAAQTDIASAPLASSSVDVVKPNVMFILDDSGSMDFAYSPDVANFASNTYGAKSSHCNGMYYNPSVVYSPPLDAAGVSYSNASFTAALNNGYNTAGGTTDLNNSTYYTYSGATVALGFTYNASGDVITNSDFYRECISSVGATPGSVVFAPVTLTTAGSTAAIKTNFANWYSYYRTRMLTMKTSAGRAFKDVGSSYRVGYSTISYTGTDSNNAEFLKISDFDATQKALFYTKLYGAVPSGGTPLRAALSKAGRIYAGRLLTGADDPVQYSCQQNFTILSTDGYWNGAAGYQLDGTTEVGNQDSTELRPMFDGTTVNNVTYTTATITFSGSNNTLVSGITVNGQQIMARAINDNENSNTVASRTAALINRNGYTATVSGSVVTIKAPVALGAITFTPVVTKTGGMTAAATAFSTTTSNVSSGGVSNSLADVAAYYYNTDLRTTALGNCTGALGGSADVCFNNVLGSSLDNKDSQHMTTFTLGLGVNGQLGFAENYLSGGSADFTAITNGTKNWPEPIADRPTAVDDLWHAAVNGRGNYFSAQTPNTLIRGITKALTSAKVRDGSGVAAATSNLEPVAGDNFLFLAMYRTSFWDGDLKLKTIDPSSGVIADTESWSAQAKLDTKVATTSDTRTIYTYSGDASNKLKAFTWLNLLTDEKAYFNSMCAPTVRLSQCSDSIGGPNLTTVQRDLISGENLLKFIRGQNGFEDQAGNANPIYRDREHVLGDMIGSQPVYVKKPPFVYVDDNYDAFKQAQRDRLGMVYVAANDGMLHAFDATIGETNSGTEKWAYIPPMVLPNLYKLADKNYPANHQYYVDGAPTVGDICSRAPASSCTANQWQTILVGGLNSGGKGYYALDVTDPANPKALWNFTDANDAGLGFTYGNPVITKRLDGTWVVVFTSGYNNHTEGGDGKGHLYVLNANTGVLLSKLDTTAGDTTTPSGLAKINAWVDSLSDNTAKRFYGGDLLGNLWRFDPDDRIAPSGRTVTLLAELGNVSPIGLQPITITPELTEVTSAGVDYPVVHIASGRYLGISDLSDTSIQSIYTLKDNLTETGLGKVRTNGVLVQQTLIAIDGSTRTTSTNPVDWANKSGWYLDLNPGNTSPGERVNVDMQQQLGLLTVAGNVPKNDACTPGGYAFIYSLDFKSGQFVAGATGNIAGRRDAGLAAGLTTLKLNTGNTVTLKTGTDGTIVVIDDPSSNPGGSGARRVSWRELIAD
jgi:type IV pilus assembly protein PilY1